MRHSQFHYPLKQLQLFLVVLGFLAGCQKSINEKPAIQSSASGDMAAASGWFRLQSLPNDFYEDFYFYNQDNCLLSIRNEVFAINGRGKMWQYNTGMNNWSRVSSLPEEMHNDPAAFSVHGKGYCMVNGHCWQYNPATNQWTRKNDPPASLFAPLVIGNKAYLLTSDSTNHLFAYEPATDTYTQQKDPPDLQLFDGQWDLWGYFVINGHGYYVGATGECWKYNASIDHWQQQAGLTVMAAQYYGDRVSFSVNNGGYILIKRLRDLKLILWRYDAALNQWTNTKDNYRGLGYQRLEAVSCDTVAYAGLGYTQDFYTTDFWRYK